ncbi:MAG: acyl carrier protein [Erysipelotrichales bacterium]
MKKEIKKIIGEVLEIEESTINDDAKILDDLGADSIAVMEIVMELEEAFDLDIDTEEIAKFKTVSDIEKYLSEQ